MIPILLLLGFVFGRWWRFVIPVAALGWAALLVVTGIDSGPRFVTAAAALGAVNATAGVLAYQVFMLALRSLTGRGSAPPR